MQNYIAHTWEELLEKLKTQHVFYVRQSENGNPVYAPIGKGGTMDPNYQVCCEYISR